MAPRTTCSTQMNVLTQGITTKAMTATMLTMPRFFGYSFNPLTTYYVYDPELVAIVLEVHNTFGEKHIYVTSGSQSISRQFHVSPFNDRLGTYNFRCTPPTSIELTLVTPEGKPKLVATLKGKQSVEMASLWALILCVRYGWWIFLTFPRILFEAWKLHYRKRLPVYMRPEPLDVKGTVWRQSPASTDSYFKSLLIRYFQWRGKSITFKILASNTLNPEIIEINPPSDTIIVLSESFFTYLACNEPVDTLAIGHIPDMQLSKYVEELSWLQRCKHYFVHKRAIMAIKIEKEFFRRIATFGTMQAE